MRTQSVRSAPVTLEESTSGGKHKCPLPGIYLAITDCQSCSVHSNACCRPSSLPKTLLHFGTPGHFLNSLFWVQTMWLPMVRSWFGHCSPSLSSARGFFTKSGHDHLRIAALAMFPQVMQPCAAHNACRRCSAIYAACQALPVEELCCEQTLGVWKDSPSTSRARAKVL